MDAIVDMKNKAAVPNNWYSRAQKKGHCCARCNAAKLLKLAESQTNSHRDREMSAL